MHLQLPQGEEFGGFICLPFAVGICLVLCVLLEMVLSQENWVFFIKNTFLSCSFQERLVEFSQTNTLSSKKRMFVTTPLLLLLSFLNVSLSCGQRKVFPGLISGAARNSSQKKPKKNYLRVFLGFLVA